MKKLFVVLVGCVIVAGLLCLPATFLSAKETVDSIFYEERPIGSFLISFSLTTMFFAGAIMASVVTTNRLLGKKRRVV